jgi:hypothetical protein
LRLDRFALGLLEDQIKTSPFPTLAGHASPHFTQSPFQRADPPFDPASGEAMLGSAGQTAALVSDVLSQRLQARKNARQAAQSFQFNLGVAKRPKGVKMSPYFLKRLFRSRATDQSAGEFQPDLEMPGLHP